MPRSFSPSSLRVVLIFIYSDRGKKTIKFHGKNDNFTWQMADLIDLSMPLFFHGIYRVGTRILHRG